jgi:hypothetical protein
VRGVAQEVCPYLSMCCLSCRRPAQCSTMFVLPQVRYLVQSSEWAASTIARTLRGTPYQGHQALRGKDSPQTRPVQSRTKPARMHDRHSDRPKPVWVGVTVQTYPGRRDCCGDDMDARPLMTCSWHRCYQGFPAASVPSNPRRFTRPALAEISDAAGLAPRVLSRVWCGSDGPPGSGSQFSWGY